MTENLNQETDTQEGPSTSDETATTSAPKKRRKRTIVIVVIVIVLLAAGIGIWIWHEQPSFCGTFCHDAMGEHVDNYYSCDASDGAGIASVHAAAGVTCLSCHKADTSTQVSELISYVEGDDYVALSSAYYVDDDTCLSCHGGSYEALAEETADLGDYNPHSSPHGNMNCDECHKGHSEQVDTCGECHDNGGQEMID
jgi:hypothetical protein